MELVAAERVKRSKRGEFLCLDPARPESLLKMVPIICLLKDVLKLPSYQGKEKVGATQKLSDSTGSNISLSGYADDF